MKKYLFIVLLVGVCFGQEIITTNETYKNGNIKEITYQKVQGNRISKHRIDYYQLDGRLNISATYDKDEKFKVNQEAYPGPGVLINSDFSEKNFS